MQLLSLGAGYLLWPKRNIPQASQTAPVSTPPAAAPSATSIEYTNSQYGFTFTLPDDWKGYTVLTETWTGNTYNASDPSATYPPVQGTELVIRNPNWTTANNWQDIPIMIFTPAQWTAVSNESLSVGAAPIAPSELGSNSNYVFALPARYNYAFPTGWQEVATIMQGNPLHAY